MCLLFVFNGPDVSCDLFSGKARRPIWTDSSATLHIDWRPVEYIRSKQIHSEGTILTSVESECVCVGGIAEYVGECHKKRQKSKFHFFLL